jgi:hypothetical protein
MNNEYVTIKCWRTTLQNLRVLAALSGERMSAVLDRLVSEALKKEQGRE